MLILNVILKALSHARTNIINICVCQVSERSSETPNLSSVVATGLLATRLILFIMRLIMFKPIYFTSTTCIYPARRLFSRLKKIKL